jgi:hypothetical protein
MKAKPKKKPLTDPVSRKAIRKALGLKLIDTLSGTDLYAKWRAAEKKEYARRKKKIQADIARLEAYLRELRTNAAIAEPS